MGRDLGAFALQGTWGTYLALAKREREVRSYLSKLAQVDQVTIPNV